jgi:chain length determinant protein EpsF
MNLSQLMAVLRARWLLVAGISLGLALAALAASLILPKRYTAEAQLVVDSRTSDPILGALLPPGTGTGYAKTQVEIIGSNRVAQRVVTALKLDQDPKIKEQWLKDTGGKGSLPAWKGADLKRRLTVLPSVDANVVTIGYSATDPEVAAAMANGFADAYIETSLELKVDPARQNAQWFDDKVHSLREKLSAAQHRLSEYQQRHGIVATDEHLDVENARLQDLSTQLVQVQGVRAESRSRHSQTENPESLPEVLQNSHVQSLKSELARLEAQQDQLAGRVGAAHPERAKVEAEIRAVRERLASETTRIAGSLGASNRMTAAREAEIQASLDAQKQKVLKLRAERDAMAVLQRDVETAQRAFNLVAERFSQTSLESQARQTNVVMLSRATAPATPSSPKLLLNTVLGALFGGVLGAGIALILELLKPRVRSAADWAETLGVPVLAELPEARIPAFRRRSSGAKGPARPATLAAG